MNPVFLIFLATIAIIAVFFCKSYFQYLKSKRDFQPLEKYGDAHKEEEGKIIKMVYRNKINQKEPLAK
jgi:membrane protein implicated in regulation of membrane protease activity